MGVESPAAGGKVAWGVEPQALSDFYKFSTKNNAFLDISKLKFLL